VTPVLPAVDMSAAAVLLAAAAVAEVDVAAVAVTNCPGGRHNGVNQKQPAGTGVPVASTWCAHEEFNNGSSLWHGNLWHRDHGVSNDHQSPAGATGQSSLIGAKPAKNWQDYVNR